MAEFRLYLCTVCYILLLVMCIAEQSPKFLRTKTKDVNSLDIEDTSIEVRRKRTAVKSIYNAAKKGVVALKGLAAKRMLLKDATLVNPSQNMYRKFGGRPRALQDMARVRLSNPWGFANGKWQFVKHGDVGNYRITLGVNGKDAVITICPKTPVKQMDCIQIEYFI